MNPIDPPPEEWAIQAPTESDAKSRFMALAARGNPHRGLELLDKLDHAEAERFVATLSRERFDYTEWRRTNLPSMGVEALSQAATRFAESDNGTV